MFDALLVCSNNLTQQKDVIKIVNILGILECQVTLTSSYSAGYSMGWNKIKVDSITGRFTEQAFYPVTLLEIAEDMTIQERTTGC